MNEIIINKAREYLGIPFLHQGRNQKTGVDCIGFVMCVLAELNIKINGKDVFEHDEFGYERIPTSFRLKEKFDEVLTQTDEISADNVGNIFLMNFGKFPQHTGFIAEKNSVPTIIHCYQQVGKVVEHRLNDVWRKRLVGVYTYPLPC